jgi:hypothetical protein
MKTYRKTATVQAKIFEQGDETGMIHKKVFDGALEDAHYGFEPDLIPYIKTLENDIHKGEFGKNYLCVGIKGERWLVDKDIFESTYVEDNDEFANQSRWISVDERLLEKDTPFFVYGLNECRKGRTMKARWIPKFYKEDDAELFLGTCDYDEETDMYYWPEGWYEWNECEETHWLIPFPITHWQPLPPAPNEVQPREEENV